MDIETTAGVLNEPIQVSAIVYGGEPVAEVSYIDAGIRPTEKMRACAIAVHGVGEKAAALLEDAGTALARLHAVLLPLAATHVWMGYNHVDFDIPLLNAAFSRLGLAQLHMAHRPLDGLLLARKLFTYEALGNHKLDTVFVHLFPDRVEELMGLRAKHDSLVDARLAFQVIQGMVAHLRSMGEPTSLSALYRVIDTPVMLELWPFGADKGKKVEEVMKTNPGIITWFLKKPDMMEKNPDLVFTLRKLMDGRRAKAGSLS